MSKKTAANQNSTVVETSVANKKGKTIGLTKERIEAIGRSLFDGIKTGNLKERKRLETERHLNYMDMYDKAHPGAKVDPVKWTDNLVRSLNQTRARIVLERTVLELSSDSVPKTASNQKTITFYKNAMGYFKNKYGTRG